MDNTKRTKGADFESMERFLSHSDTVTAGKGKLTSSGLPLDYLGEGRYAVSRREQHCLVIGDTGCGKTRRLIIPAIKLMGDTGESMVISDPKGELYQKTAHGLREKGYSVRVVNMREPRRGDRWNPMEIVWTLCHSDDDDRKDKGYIMLDEIIDLMAQSVHSERDVFWENIAKQYIRAIALIILEYGKKEELSFWNIASAEAKITSILQKRIERRENEESGEEDGDTSVFFSFLDALSPESPIRENIQSAVCITSSATFTSVASVAHTMTMEYTRQSAVRFLLSATDYDISALGRESTVLYLILPDEIATLYPLATLLVSQIYSVLVDEAYENGGILKTRVNFILDEFANFTRMKNISSMLTASRSRGMRFFLVCQDVDQLDNTYGVSASVIRSNCQNWIYMGTRNTEFLEMLETLGGTYYEHYTHESYPLLSVSSLQSLEIGEAIVFLHRSAPKLSHFPDFSEVKWGDEESMEETFPARSTASAPSSFDVISLMREGERRILVCRDSLKRKICDYYRSVFEKGAPDEKELSLSWERLEKFKSAFIRGLENEIFDLEEIQ